MVIDFRLVAKLLAPALFLFGIVAFIPAIYALCNTTHGIGAFVATGIIGLFVSFCCHTLGKKAGQNPSIRVLFLFTTSFGVAAIYRSVESMFSSFMKFISTGSAL